MEEQQKRMLRVVLRCLLNTGLMSEDALVAELCADGIDPHGLISVAAAEARAAERPSCDVSILHRQGISPNRKREYHSVWDCNKETLQELGRGVKLPKPILEKIHWVKQSFPYHGGYDEARDLAAAFVLGPGAQIVAK